MSQKKLLNISKNAVYISKCLVILLKNKFSLV